MSNRIIEEMNKIDIPRELSDRSKLGVLQAKSEMKMKMFKRRGFLFAASLLVGIGTYAVTNDLNLRDSQPEQTLFASPDGSITIPEIKLPEENSKANMIGLIVYNNKIYTQTDTEIIAKHANSLIGDKLGMTKGTIDEWSSHDEYTVEFASTVGITDVYSVKGYDQDFRIMTYEEKDGKVYAEIFESLNNITIENGEDLFGKLKIINNVNLAQIRYYSDFYNSTANYQNIADLNLIHSFFETLNETKPILQEDLPLTRHDYYNDERFRELIVYLNDGTKVRITLFEGGYVHYGYMPIYFKMEDLEIFNQVWVQLPLTD
ncbi:hypothetical protein CIB95_06355 [Lottiidibacillus patelloidae]|uniref:Uncharacterized protein n=1 Tax=Lottiidibacillus patelloidae TaxID=2670334 RepID=A0A263BW86_9BACI|nr:hypothetical protein [Lottiidibacillus patelloidae]OZM57974.1 hypothetical protein CIB95_06355 [Lottiidibacillus patelloidae]